jgi:ribose transport system ATP-binding protein
VYQLADAFAVLRDGRLIRQGRLADQRPARLIHDISGHEPQRHAISPAPEVATPVLRLTGVVTPGCGPVSLELRAGEVVGMVGLTGAGHIDLGRALAGSRPLLGGEALLDGKLYRPGSVAAAVDAGVGFVTSNRQEEGCAPELTVRENLLANPHADGLSPLAWISPRRERRQAAELIERFQVLPPDCEAPIATLSGGNQQKVMLGRWLGISRRKVMILEEPTAGVDISAKAEIYRLLDRALVQGLAVLLISSDFEEVADVCHRALVFVNGTVADQLSGKTLNVARLTRSAAAKTVPTEPAEHDANRQH